MDMQRLNEGFQDAISESSPKLQQEEIQSILTALKNQIEMQQRQHFSQVAEANKKQSENFLTQQKRLRKGFRHSRVACSTKSFPQALLLVPILPLSILSKFITAEPSPTDGFLTVPTNGESLMCSLSIGSSQAGRKYCSS